MPILKILSKRQCRSLEGLKEWMTQVKVVEVLQLIQDSKSFLESEEQNQVKEWLKKNKSKMRESFNSKTLASRTI